MPVPLFRSLHHGPEILGARPVPRFAQPVRQLVEPRLDEGGEDRLTVGEVVVGSLVGAAGATRHLPHAERGRPALVQ